MDGSESSGNPFAYETAISGFGIWAHLGTHVKRDRVFNAMPESSFYRLTLDITSTREKIRPTKEDPTQSWMVFIHPLQQIKVIRNDFRLAS